MHVIKSKDIWLNQDVEVKHNGRVVRRMVVRRRAIYVTGRRRRNY